jgi:hypothetical protein
MKLAAVAFAAMLSAFCFLDAAYAANVWDAYHADLRARCPSRHVDWICDDCQDDLIDDFLSILPEQTRRKVSAMGGPEAQRACADQMGFYCEMGAYLDTFRKLNLLKQFVAYGCRTESCTEVAICTKTSN